MQSLLAGWVAGYALSVAFTLIGTLFVLAAMRPAEGQALHSPLAIGVALSIGSFLVWTLIGLVLGGVYPTVADATTGGAGLPSLAFTGGVAAVCGIATVGASIVAGRVWWHVVALGLLTAAAFGVVLPLLAERDV